jgi:RNA recognition motif-containing protein
MSIYVGNIPSIVDHEVLQEEFSSFGPAKISYFVISTQGKFAYIEYSSLSTARQALLSWNGRFMGGQILNIEYHFEHPEESLTKIENSSKPSKSEHETIQPLEADPLFDLISKEKLIPPKPLPEVPSEPLHSFPQSSKPPSSTPKKNPRPPNDDDSESIERPKTRSSKFSLEVGDALIEANPEIFKQKKKSRHHPENSLIFCELCEKDFKKKYIRDHINSRRHISKQLN